MKENILKLITDLKERYIDEWGTEPQTIYMNVHNVKGLERLDIKGAVCGMDICASSRVEVGHFLLDGRVGERH